MSDDKVTGVCIDIPTIVKQAKEAKRNLAELEKLYDAGFGFAVPKYEYKGMPIYTREDVPLNEIRLYDTRTNQMTVIKLPEGEKDD